MTKKDIVKKYVVIGGQYASISYGIYNSLHAAKIAATKNIEIWDNWQGKKKPAIYDLNDCEECNNFYGKNYRPKEQIVNDPIFIWNEKNNKWIETDYYKLYKTK